MSSVQGPVRQQLPAQPAAWALAPPCSRADLSQLQTGLEASRLLFEDTAAPRTHGARRTKKKKAKPPEKRCSRGHLAAQPHYRLCLGDMPFVAGKSTSPSHAVVANVQHVLHLMKQHSRALCNDRVVSSVPLARHASSRGGRARKPATPPPPGSVSEELSEVLQTLQDEFGQMSFDHQQLAKLIQESPTAELRDNLESELEALVGRMEAKAGQITKVRKYQAQVPRAPSLVLTAAPGGRVRGRQDAPPGRFPRPGTGRRPTGRLFPGAKRHLARCVRRLGSPPSPSTRKPSGSGRALR
ncbi:PREDICTED: centrosomal protein of 57 kDa, partial [Condylura cristata]|uniref:centrosomal protein of 57 kDa n=1 Tax=Condylura cristata TaxID=143302 RepID=UPI000642A88E